MKLRGLHYWIVVLVLVTAVLHLAAALDRQLFPDGPDPIFMLNALGYLGLLGAYFLPIPFLQKRHRLVGWILFVYAIITILAWLAIWVVLTVLIHGQPFFSRDSIYGVPAKIAELALLVLLQRDRTG
jgi:hypothetical protein